MIVRVASLLDLLSVMMADITLSVTLQDEVGNGVFNTKIDLSESFSHGSVSFSTITNHIERDLAFGINGSIS